MTTRRSALLRATAALAAGFAAPWSRLRAQPEEDPAQFPQRPLFVLVPWAAGGGTDLTLRVLAEFAGRRLGQRVLIENRGGAGGTLAMPVLQHAAPDGYTLAQMPQPVFRAPYLHKLGWDPVRDTTPILQVSSVTFGLLVPADSPLRDVAELLALAAADPGALSLATNGVGTTPHLALDTLFARRGLAYVHVPYKGAAEQLNAIAAGQVTAGACAGFAPYVDSGRLRLLATFSPARSRRWPQVPTLRELGHDIVGVSPYGLAGPRGLPPRIVRRLHDAFKAALFEPAYLAELTKYDQEPAYLDSDAYGQSMREAQAVERAIVQRLGLVAARP